MSGPHARLQTVAGRLFSREAEIFSPGVSWALCFYKDQDTIIPEFRPPQAGPLDRQRCALYIPYHDLSFYAEHVQTGPASWVLRLKDQAAHCRLKIFKCDSSGAPQQWSHNLRAYYCTHIYHDGHFKFSISQPHPGALLEPGCYFIECEFFSSHWELEQPDAKYTTGTFEIASSLRYDLLKPN